MPTFAALVGISGASAAMFPGERDLSNYDYKAYLNEFPYKIPNADDISAREAIFNSNLGQIIQHNNMSSKTWFADVNQFADMSPDEFRAAIKGRKSVMDSLFTGPSQTWRTNRSVADLPDAVDWRTEGVVTPVKDQGSCGSCWAFSTAQTFESHFALAFNEPVQELSAQQIVSCAPNPQKCGGSGGCDGSTQPLGFDYTKTGGLSTESSYPYQAITGTCQQSKIEPVGYNTGYVQLPENDYTALMTAVATVGPIAISIAASGGTFQFYGGGVLSGCKDFVMDHAVQLVGYGSDSGADYWLVRNSWGESYGESGYIRLQRYGEGKEPCGKDKSPQDGDACEGDTAVRTYCGECGVLSASSYPTGMTKTQPPPSPPTPKPPTPPLPPSPPSPPCVDTQTGDYCEQMVEMNFCQFEDQCDKSCDKCFYYGAIV